MQLGWFAEKNILLIVLILLAAMMIAAEISFRAGRKRRTDAEGVGKSYFAPIQTSLLGLLALLLAFTFGMALQRYETRSKLVIDEANLLNGLYLRSSVLPDPQQSQFKQLLGQYVDVRVAPILDPQVITVEKVKRIAQLSEKIHRQMWDLVQEQAKLNPVVKGIDAMVQQLIETFAVYRMRVYAFENRVPDLVIWLLFIAALIAMTAIGYSGGLWNHRGMMARTLLAILVCTTVYVMLSLDNPQSGFIRVKQPPLIQFKQMIDKG